MTANIFTEALHTSLDKASSLDTIFTPFGRSLSAEEILEGLPTIPKTFSDLQVPLSRRGETIALAMRPKPITPIEMSNLFIFQRAVATVSPQAGSGAGEDSLGIKSVPLLVILEGEASS